MFRVVLAFGVLLFATSVEAQTKTGGALEPTVLKSEVRLTAHGGSDIPPTDDSGKWFVSFFTTPNCAACIELKSDLKNDTPLLLLSKWAHVNSYDMSRVSQRFRFADYKIKEFPTIVVTPPPGGKYPYCYVLRETGYDGNSESLVERITGAVIKFRSLHGEDNWAVIPDTPPMPVPTPPTPGPTPAPPAPVETESELLLVVDDSSWSEEMKGKAVVQLMEYLETRFGEDVKVRKVSYLDAQEIYPVQRGDTPAVILTRNGHVMAFINAGAASAVYEDSLPSFLQFGGWGIVGVLVLVVVGRGFYNSRKKKVETSRYGA